MSNPSQDELYPKSLVLPVMTTAQRRAMAADIGTLVYDSDLGQIVVASSKTVAIASWEKCDKTQDA